MNQILLISKSVKIHETLFSLPFEYFGCIYANNGIVDWGILFYVTILINFEIFGPSLITFFLQIYLNKHLQLNRKQFL